MFEHLIHEPDFSPLVDLSTTSALAALPSMLPPRNHVQHHLLHHPILQAAHLTHPHSRSLPLPSLGAVHNSVVPVSSHPFETPDMRQVREEYEQLRRKYRDMRVKEIARAFTHTEVEENPNTVTSASSSAAQRSYSMSNTDGHERTASRAQSVSRHVDAKGRATTEEASAHKESVDGKVTVDRKTHTLKGPDGKLKDLLRTASRTASRAKTARAPSSPSAEKRGPSSTRKVSAAPQKKASNSKPTAVKKKHTVRKGGTRRKS
jgi:hypothetical protein